jgi:predicted NAD-dependent protein-ADP-ribosyltransferase YbiA (DUF1768 family)
MMGDAAGIINFYSVSDEFGEFSNFAAYPIALNGKFFRVRGTKILSTFEGNRS